jgi:hypothetical protein
MANIIDKVRELQAAIREQYGVEADIEVRLHNTCNPHLNKELANWISLQLAQQCHRDNIWTYANESSEGYRWVKLETLDNIEFIAYYGYGS